MHCMPFVTEDYHEHYASNEYIDFACCGILVLNISSSGYKHLTNGLLQIDMYSSDIKCMQSSNLKLHYGVNIN